MVTQAPMAQKRDWVYMLLLMLEEARGNGGRTGRGVKLASWALLVLLASAWLCRVLGGQGGREGVRRVECLIPGLCQAHSQASGGWR